MAKQAYELLSNYHQFPTFQTREDYERATGGTCPPWDSTRRPKCWADPNPEDVGLEGPSGEPLTIYNALDPVSGAQSEPRTKKFTITLADAKTVNIPPRGLGMTNVPSADAPEIPTPLKPLAPTQKLVRYQMSVMVRNLDVELPTEQATAGADETLRLVRAIAAKLGVSVE